MADLLPLAAGSTPDTPRCATRSATSGSTSPTPSSARPSSEVAAGLIDLGIEPGDKVSILANTRPEWTYACFGILAAGATLVSIYQTNSPRSASTCSNHSESKAVFVEDAEQLAKVRAGPRTSCRRSST